MTLHNNSTFAEELADKAHEYVRIDDEVTKLCKARTTCGEELVERMNIHDVVDITLSNGVIVGRGVFFSNTLKITRPSERLPVAP